MKRGLLTGIIGGFACTLMSFQMAAQSSAPGTSLQADAIKTSVFSVGNFVNAPAAGKEGTRVDAADVSGKVHKTFMQVFGERTNVAWTQLGKKVFLAQFDLDGRKTNAVFESNGYMPYAISYGEAKDLPRNVRSELRSVYGDYDIGNTFEIKYRDEATGRPSTAWVINLADDDQIVLARIKNDGVDELARYDSKPQMRTKIRKGKVIVSSPSKQH